MKDSINKALAELGIPPRIGGLFIALIHEGSAGVARLARLVDRPKSSVLDDLKWLSKNGYVTRHKKKNAYIFTADPDYIFDEFAKRRREAEYQEQQASNVASELKTFFNVPTKKPKIEYYEGHAGIRLAYEDTLKEPNKEIIGYGSVCKKYETTPKFFPEYYEKRIKRRISFRGLMPITPETLEECYNHDQKHLRKSYFIGLDKYQPIQIDVYGDTILIISLTELFVVKIQSSPVAETFRNIIELAIEGAKKEDAEIRIDIEKKGLKKKIAEVEKEFKRDILEV